MLSFKFGDKDSFEDFGIYIEKRPTIPSPKRRVGYVVIPGRSGTIKYDENAYDDITIAVECGIAKDVYSKMDAIKGWLLSGGERELIFSFQSEKCYKAQVVNSIDFEVSLRRIGKFVVIFNCRPFKYAVDNKKIEMTKSGINLINVGTVESNPIIEVIGKGNITLRINEKEVLLKDISSNIILNSNIQDAYNSEFKSENSRMTGDFPVFSVGENKIEWEGNITKLIVTPNWRWL